MKHLILGAGNLGIDLFIALEKKHGKGNVRLLSAHPKDDRDEFSYPYEYNTVSMQWRIRDIALANPEVVWCCIGAGSVESAKEDFNRHIDLHLKLPVELISGLPASTKLVLFSTDYLSDSSFNPEHRSLYALSKEMMERYVRKCGKPNVFCFRVGSLYGIHKPYNTFPGKVFRHFNSTGLKVSLPENDCCPTPTEWLAETLSGFVEEYQYPYDRIMFVSPTKTETFNWGRSIIGVGNVSEDGYDTDRPFVIDDCYSIGEVQPSWEELWSKYGTRLMERLKLDQIRLSRERVNV